MDPFRSVFLDNDTLLLSPSPSKQPLNNKNNYHQHNWRKSDKADADENVAADAVITNHPPPQQQQQQQQQLLQYVNHSLTSVGSSEVDPFTSVQTLTVIVELLNQRKMDSQLLEDARMKSNKLTSNNRRLLSDKQRLRSQKKILEQEIASIKHRLKRMEVDSKKESKNKRKLDTLHNKENTMQLLMH
jgi:hypothetical protein